MSESTTNSDAALSASDAAADPTPRHAAAQPDSSVTENSDPTEQIAPSDTEQIHADPEHLPDEENQHAENDEYADDEGYDEDDYDEQYDEDDYAEPVYYGGSVHNDDIDVSDGGWAGTATDWQIVPDDDDVPHLVLTNEDVDVAIDIPLHERLSETIIDALCDTTGYYPEPDDETRLARNTGWSQWSRIWDDIPPKWRTIAGIVFIAVLIIGIVLKAIF